MMLVCLFGSIVLGGEMGSSSGIPCKYVNGTVDQDSLPLVILTDPDHSVSSTINNTTSQEACCAACNSWSRSKPCAGFAYDPAAQTCYLKSKLGTVIEGQNGSMVVGFPAQQNFKLNSHGESPESFQSLGITYTNVDGPEHCGWYCLVTSKCVSYKYQPTALMCELGDTVSSDPHFNLVPDAGVDFYQLDYNTPQSHDKHDGTAKSRYLIVGGATFQTGSTYTPGNSIVEFNADDETFTVVGSLQNPRAHHIAALHNNRLIIDGGSMVLTEISSDNVYPFNLMSHNQPFERALFGCGGIVNSDYYYTCFGHTTPNQCHMYSLKMGDNYAKTSTVNMTEPTRSFPTCAQKGNVLYVMGGFPATPSFYKYDLMSEQFDHLASLPTTSMAFSYAVWLHGRIVTCGGWPTNNECYEYDTQLDQWNAFPSMVNNRSRHQMASWGEDKLVVFGGYSGSAAMDTVEIYENDHWRLLSAKMIGPLMDFQLIPLQ